MVKPSIEEIQEARELMLNTPSVYKVGDEVSMWTPRITNWNLFLEKWFKKPMPADMQSFQIIEVTESSVKVEPLEQQND